MFLWMRRMKRPLVVMLADLRGRGLESGGGMRRDRRRCFLWRRKAKGSVPAAGVAHRLGLAPVLPAAEQLLSGHPWISIQ